MPFVEWDRREFNSLADHAANVTLDMGADWQQDGSMKAIPKPRCNLRLCVDGARRGSSEAAAGLALIAYLPDGTEVIALRAGKRLGQLKSAFVSEMLALEWGLEVLSSFIS
jgi:hypothetical protein